MRKAPIPRTSSYFGRVGQTPTVREDGSWLECESFAYPNGGMTRRARVWCGDMLRVVQCGIPDTFFSIPACVTYGHKYRAGFITDTDGKLEFTENGGGV